METRPGLCGILRSWLDSVPDDDGDYLSRYDDDLYTTYNM